MRRILAIAALAVALAAPASAQQATLPTPVARPAEHNLRVESYYATRDGGGRWEVVVSVRAQDGTEIRRQSVSGPDDAHATATAAAFNAALLTPLGGEPGPFAQKANYRVLRFLKDQLYTPFDVATIE